MLPPLEFPIPTVTLQRHDLRPKRSFGQNFLTDALLVDKIAALGGDTAGEAVEIGAGLGGLTVALLNRGHRVTAIERDRDLLPVLRDVLAIPIADGRVELLEADAKSLNPSEMFQGTDVRLLMGNLPYNITGLLLQQATRAVSALTAAIFLVQLEVANRLVAKPGEADYGALSVFTQAAFEIRRAMVVRRGAFYPQPNVDSAVVVLTPRLNIIEETPRFRSLVKRAFEQRRKTLRNAWKGLAPSPMLAQAANTAGIVLNARGETLSPTAFAKMASELSALELIG